MVQVSDIFLKFSSRKLSKRGEMDGRNNLRRIVGVFYKHMCTKSSLASIRGKLLRDSKTLHTNIQILRDFVYYSRSGYFSSGK